MPDMHRPRRIGRDVFDIDLFAAAGRAVAVSDTGLQDFADLFLPESPVQPKVYEAGPRHLDTLDACGFGQFRRNAFGQITRLKAGGFGQYHRHIGRNIAMRRIPGRFHRNPVDRKARRKIAGGSKIRHDFFNRVAVGIENVHLFSSYKSNNRRCSSSANRSVIPAI